MFQFSNFVINGKYFLVRNNIINSNFETSKIHLGHLKRQVGDKLKVYLTVSLPCRYQRQTGARECDER